MQHHNEYGTEGQDEEGAESAYEEGASNEGISEGQAVHHADGSRLESQEVQFKSDV